MPSELIEKMARVLYECEFGQYVGTVADPIEHDLPSYEDLRDDCMARAFDVLRVLASTPPSPAMIAAASNGNDCQKEPSP